MTEFFVGTSGWHYEHWKGRFYPEGLPKSRWLEFYAGHFGAVEVNNTFYRLPKESAFEAWRDASPEGFCFSLKVSRFITQVKRLRDIAGPVANFVRRATVLGGKLGPLLYQTPPVLQRDEDRLKGFLLDLPSGLRHALEFRHPSWFDDRVYSLLREHNVALCMYSMPSYATPAELTADFAYVRFHGAGAMYGGSYSDSTLRTWAKRIAGLGPGMQAAYLYFNNDAMAYAVGNALTMARLLGPKTG